MFDSIVFDSAKAVNLDNGEVIEVIENKNLKDPQPMSSSDDIKFPYVTTYASDDEIVLFDSSDNMPYIVNRNEAMDKGLRYPIYS